MTSNTTKMDIDSVTVDYLIENEVDIVISNKLPREWYFTLKGLKIVTVTLGNREECVHYSEIVIDYLNKDDKRYFTGKDYSMFQNGNLKIDGIFDLIEIMDWDSTFFGFKIAYLSCMHLTENIMYRIEKFIKNENINLVEYLCNCHDRRSVRVAEKNEFQFVDIRLTYKKSITRKEHVSLDKWAFDRAGERDIAALKKMVSGGFYKDSRYFFDGNFNVQKTDEFFQLWIEKGIKGQYDAGCWCLYDNKIPVAFCTLRFEGKERAYIGIFGIDRRFQGLGLGKKMLLSVFKMLAEKSIRDIYVVTQGRNYDAQRLYQSVGFRTEATQLWYHKWVWG